MKMIDILKQELKEGMAIENDRELSDKYKLTIAYDGMAAPVVLAKTCAPGCEKELCRKVIDTAMSTMYVNAGNLAEAKKWLDGEIWKGSDENSDNTSICFEIGDYSIEYGKPTENFYDAIVHFESVNDLEELISDLVELKEIYLKHQ